MKETRATSGLANNHVKKELKDAERTAVFIRRMEYATSMKRQMKLDKNLKDHIKKIEMIQEWWKTMHKIIKLQKNIRGFLFRKKLMNNLEHQEKLLQFITEFDNIHNYHQYKQFFDNLKKKADYEKARQMERCEDLGEKLDNLEKMHNARKLKECINKWKDEAMNRKKNALDNFANKLADVFNKKKDEINKDTYQDLKNIINNKDLEDKIKNLNDILSNVKNNIDDRLKKDALDKLKNNDEDEKLKIFANDIENLLQNKQKNDDDDMKRKFMDRLKEIANRSKLDEAFQKWKNIQDELKNRKSTLQKLKKQKEEENKKKFTIDNVEEFEILSDKPKENNLVTSENEINIPGKEKVEKLFSPEGAHHFSLLPPEKILFNFGEINDPHDIIDKNKILDQIDNIDKFLDEKKLRNALRQWKENADRCDCLNALKEYKKNENDKLNNLENLIDNFDKKKNDDLLRKYFNKWRENANKLKENEKKNLELFVEKVDNILLEGEKKKANEMQKEFFEILKDNQKNSDIDEAMKHLKKYVCGLKKELIEYYLRPRKIEKAIDILENFLKNKDLKDAFDELKKQSGMGEGFRMLDKLHKNHLKREFFDALKNIDNVGGAANTLDDIIKKKLKQKLLIRLKKNNDTAKAANNLEKLTNNKLKKDALNKFKDFVNKEKLRDALHKWKEQTEKQEIKDKLKDYINKKKLKDAFNKWKEQTERLEIIDKLKDFESTKNLKDAFNKWKEQTERQEIKDKLKDYLIKKNAFNKWKNMTDLKNLLKNLIQYQKEKQLGNLIKGIDENQESKNKLLLQKYFDKWKKKTFKEKKSKRISNRRKRARSKSRAKSKQKNANKKLLKKFFDRWKNNASFKPTKTVLDKIKQNKQMNAAIGKGKDLFQKLKRKCLQVILNIYKKQNLRNLKKYFDKWNKIKNLENSIPNNNSLHDSDSFQPQYITNEKTNLYKRAPRNLKPDSENEEEDLKNKQKPKINNYVPKKIIDDYSDSTSNNNSDCDMVLIETRKETKNARNYTSQSFFIDKRNNNAAAKNDYQINTHITNKLPMTMKGDFISLIEDNQKILKQKNPRIQVTNATCELDSIIDEDNVEEDEMGPEEIDTEITKLKSNYNITKNKIITKVIQNCDHDLYASRKPFKAKKSQWYSVSIPLNKNEARWEFLNNIKGEREKTNLNKFELIQHETILSEINGTPEKEKNKEKTINKISQISEKKTEFEYKLREVNFTQFYRSPIRSPRNNEEEKENPNINRVIRKPEPIRNNRYVINGSIRANKFDPRNRFSNNIYRSRGKVEMDVKNRSLNYQDENDSDEDDFVEMNRSAGRRYYRNYGE